MNRDAARNKKKATGSTIMAAYNVEYAMKGRILPLPVAPNLSGRQLVKQECR